MNETILLRRQRARLVRTHPSLTAGVAHQAAGFLVTTKKIQTPKRRQKKQRARLVRTHPSLTTGVPHHPRLAVGLLLNYVPLVPVHQ
jgi:peroxiredoxin